jgi:large subunit ribosomal protein L7/L12
MTVLELNDLRKAIEEEFGVTAAAPVAVAAAPRRSGCAPPLTKDRARFPYSSESGEKKSKS